MSVLASLGISSYNAGAYIGDSWVSPLSISSLTSINPATGEPLAQVGLCSMIDYQTVMAQSEAAFLDWRVVPAPRRGEVIRQIGQRLREHKTSLARLLSLEMGKSYDEALGEVQEMIDMADFAVGQSRMLYGKTMPSERPHHRMSEQWHPYGVVGVISAFNFPVAVWAWNAFLSAICGNVTVWKPSSKTPLVAIAVHKLCQTVLAQNGCPDIFSLFLPESQAITDAFVADKRVALLSFTGSTAVGRQVAVTVAARLGRSLLELGGNNAVILEASADISLAVSSVVFGAVGTAGQRCTSTRRLFVHDTIYHRVLDKLQQAYQSITVDTLMGPLIDANAVEQFIATIARIKAAGGTIVFGGNVLKRPGYFVEPTLVTGLANDSDIVQEETFAPILYVMPYHRLEEAIALQNAVPQGLSSALFTNELRQAEHYLSVEGSDCGIANVNIGTSGAEIGGAFGGEKDSGGGRESGSDAWKAYMRRQTNTIHWGSELSLAQGITFQR